MERFGIGNTKKTVDRCFCFLYYFKLHNNLSIPAVIKKSTAAQHENIMALKVRRTL
jgi:hypothetical protein